MRLALIDDSGNVAGEVDGFDHYDLDDTESDRPGGGRALIREVKSMVCQVVSDGRTGPAVGDGRGVPGDRRLRPIGFNSYEYVSGGATFEITDHGFPGRPDQPGRYHIRRKGGAGFGWVTRPRAAEGPGGRGAVYRRGEFRDTGG